MRSVSYSTSNVSQGDRRAYWEASIGRYFGRLRSEHLGDDVFAAAFDSYDIDGIVAVRMNVSSSRVTRETRDAVDDGGTYLKLSMQVAGHAAVSVGGKSMQLGEGDWIVLDQRHPYVWESSSDSRMFGLQIPRQRLRGIKLPALMFSGSQELTPSGMVPVLGSYLRALDQQLPSIGDGAALMLADATIGLLATTLEDGRRHGAQSPSDPLAMLRLRAAHYAKAHAGDAELSVDTLASALHCSRRYLYKAFADEAMSPEKLIWNARLERCHEALHDPRNLHRSVASIAYDCGFNSDAHFSRLFKARYGLSAARLRTQSMAPT